MNLTQTQPKKIFLAEDDADDRMFFEDVLKEVSISTNLVMADDGVELMSVLEETVPPPPDIIFLDLNMPRKNGFECLKEIRQTDKLSKIPVIIFSTSDNAQAIDKTYSLGANFYMQKPRSFALLKKAIETVLSADLETGGKQVPKEKYLLAIA
jgi:CheY-like chemotaxis protein